MTKRTVTFTMTAAIEEIVDTELYGENRTIKDAIKDVISNYLKEPSKFVENKDVELEMKYKVHKMTDAEIGESLGSIESKVKDLLTEDEQEALEVAKIKYIDD